MNLSYIKAKTPWWCKITAKIFLSRIPLKYNIWRRIGIFKHGYMKQPRYAYEVFKHHYDSVASYVNLNNYTVLELGPGDSLFTAIVAQAFGARQCYLVDTSSCAIFDLQAYREMAKFISEKAMLTLDIENTKTLDELLSMCNTHYGTNGLETLHALPDRSIDFVFSQAVLEHVRKKNFLALIQ